MVACNKHQLCGIAINIENSIIDNINNNHKKISTFDVNAIKVYVYD